MNSRFNIDEIRQLWALTPGLLPPSATPLRFISVQNGVKDDLKAQWRKRFENRSVSDKKEAPQLEVKNATGETAEILLYDEIGFWGITAKQFATQLKNVTAKNILLRINSPGGDVFDGIAIHNSLKQHGATITARVDGWAASIASIIALAGNTVQMAPSSFMMIHRAWGIAIGNAAEFTNMAGVLNKLDGTLADIYAKKTEKTAAEMLDLMKGDTDGTWFTADEAKEIGLADEVTDPEEEDDDKEDDDEAAAAIAAVNRMRNRLSLATVEV